MAAKPVAAPAKRRAAAAAAVGEDALARITALGTAKLTHAPWARPCGLNGSTADTAKEHARPPSVELPESCIDALTAATQSLPFDPGDADAEVWAATARAGRVRVGAPRAGAHAVRRQRGREIAGRGE